MMAIKKTTFDPFTFTDTSMDGLIQATRNVGWQLKLSVTLLGIPVSLVERRYFAKNAEA